MSPKENKFQRVKSVLFKRPLLSPPIPPGGTRAAFPPEPTRIRRRTGQGRPTSAALIGIALTDARSGAEHCRVFGSDRICHELTTWRGAARRALQLWLRVLFMGDKGAPGVLHSPQPPPAIRSVEAFRSVTPTPACSASGVIFLGSGAAHLALGIPVHRMERDCIGYRAGIVLAIVPGSVLMWLGGVPIGRAQFVQAGDCCAAMRRP
jgi:hypothetical protein